MNYICAWKLSELCMNLKIILNLKETILKSLLCASSFIVKILYDPLMPTCPLDALMARVRLFGVVLLDIDVISAIQYGFQSSIEKVIVERVSKIVSRIFKNSIKSLHF